MFKKNPIKILIVSYVLIALLTLSAVIIAGKTYTVYLSNPYAHSNTSVEVLNKSVVEESEISKKGEYLKVVFRAKQSGKSEIKIKITNADNEKENTQAYYEMSVLPTNVIFVSGFDYGGYQAVLLGIFLLTVFTFGFALYKYRLRKKQQFFSYKTVIDLALIIFFGLQSLMYLVLFLGSVIIPEKLSGWYVYNLVGFVMSAIFMLSIPLLVLSAAFLSISNIALIKHEGLARNNLFGLLISAFVFAGAFVCILVILKYPNSTGITYSEMNASFIRSIISSAFVYFECVLLATQICTQFAARHEPKHNQDFILILGCQIRKDGTPTPLLKGRIERAMEFHKKQLAENGKTAIFIPTGGKGADEIISEGECMKNYLLEHGIPENLICAETESATTLENMIFSKRIAHSIKPNANILFSTTNYHIFRSGILSAKAGLRADGIGAKTKWYFWPNAQMREFIGLLACEWKINILFILFTVILSAVMANTSAIVNFLVK